MQNLFQPGETLIVASLAGGVVSGNVVLINYLLGVAALDPAVGAKVEVTVDGVFGVPELSTDVIVVGDTLYRDSTPGEMSLTATAKFKAGYAIEAASSGAPLAKVKLTPGAAQRTAAPRFGNGGD